MKAVTSLLMSCLIFLGVSSAHAEYVNGYYKSNGTYVQGYYRTPRNNTNVDNYSYNPRTDTPRYYNSYSDPYNYRYEKPRKKRCSKYDYYCN